MATILIIDDQSVSLKILGALVRSLDASHEIKSFTNPELALAWIIQNPVSLVLTDYSMPGMNGVEFIRQVRRHFPDTRVPVIVISANTTPYLRNEVLDAGATAILSKPVNRQVLHEQFSTILS